MRPMSMLHYMVLNLLYHLPHAPPVALETFCTIATALKVLLTPLWCSLSPIAVGVDVQWCLFKPCEVAVTALSK